MLLGALLALCVTTHPLLGQNKNFPIVPEESQAASVSQTIGLVEVTITYSRPNMMERRIFGEQVPWGTVWRVGANTSTKIHFDQSVYLDGHQVPAGTYSLLAIPQPERWTIILNKDTGLWGHYGYDQAKDLLRFEVAVSQSQDFEETLAFGFLDVDKWSAKVQIAWGHYRAQFEVSPDEEWTDQTILTDIKEKIGNPKYHVNEITTAHIYMISARYYFETDNDLEQAAEWMEKAIEISPVNYFFLYQADILEKLGRTEEALAASKQGLAKYQKEGTNKEWIWRYQSQIARLEKGRSSK